MAKFVRLQLIVGEDLTKSLLAFGTDLEASCEAFMSDITRALDLHPNNPTSSQVKATLQNFQQTISLKVALPLVQLEAAHGAMEAFMQKRLEELSSQTKS